MRASTAYFVGAGTIIAAIGIGLGGGIVAGNIMTPVATKPDTSKMAQRAEAAATPAKTNASSERVDYLTSTQSFGTVVAAPAQARDEAKVETKPEMKAEAQAIQANAEPAAPPQSQAAAVEPPKPAPAPVPQAAKPAQQPASTEPLASSDNAYAKARDSDVKRAASERRRADRRERWADRRRYDARDPRGMRDGADLDDVARNVREDSDARDYAGRSRGGFKLFGRDED